jgi:hypothetical protein
VAPRDLILTTAEGYGVQQLRPFVESLGATGFDGEIRCVASDLGAETLDYLAANGIETISPRRIGIRVRGSVRRVYSTYPTARLWRLQPFVGGAVRTVARLTPDPVGALAALTGALSHIYIARYGAYYRFLRTHVERYRNVLLTDSRDVVFLRRPLEDDYEGGVHFYLEDGSWTIATEEWDRGWILKAYGPGALEQIGERPVSCAGVTAGAAPAVLAYLEAMVEQLGRLRQQWLGIDQGVHNYVVHTGRVPGTLVANETGPVLTVGLMSDAAASTALRARKDELTLVHQYDRHRSLGALLLPVDGTVPLLAHVGERYAAPDAAPDSRRRR